MSTNSNNTQIIDPSTGSYNTNNMVFAEPAGGSIPGGGPSIAFQRINIGTKNADGTTGDLVLQTGRLFSFGVSENTSPDTGKVNGWTMPLCLWGRDGASPSEKAWTDAFDAIVEKCIDHLMENKEEIDKYDLERSELKKFNPLYWKKVKGTVNGKPQLVIADGTGPTLYSKLIYSKKNEKFVTQFYDIYDDPIDPMELLGKYSYVTAAVKIESIFIGNKISLQVKLYEADVEPMQSGMKRLISRPKAERVVTTATPEASVADVLGGGNESDDDDGSIEMEKEPEPEPEPKPVTKKVVRRVVKKT
jgi:hypothetical protein